MLWFMGYSKLLNIYMKHAMQMLNLSKDGETTPLHYATTNNHIEIIQYLIETCHVNVDTKDSEWCSSILHASHDGNLELVKYYFETCQANIEIKDNRGNTPLDVAASSNKYEVVTYLCDVCNANITPQSIKSVNTK